MTTTGGNHARSPRHGGREDHPAPARHRVGARALWFGVLGAPAAWSAHTVIATSINSSACIVDRDATAPAGVQAGTVIWIVLLVLSVTLLVVAVSGLVTSIMNWRSTTRAEVGKEELLDIGEGRTRFMAMGGILLGAIFSLLLVFNSIAVLIAPQCTP
jgi:hypothetical protein